MSPRDIECPYCKAAPGVGCSVNRHSVSLVVTGYHKPRVQRANRQRRGQRRGPDLRHGLSYTPEYRAWQLIRLRCTDPDHAAYPRYGGRGITMYTAWIDDPTAFVAHVGPRPTPAHEIDREDNDRGYEPGNVRWVTRVVNSNNRRSNRVVEYRGKRATTAEWCERLGLPYSTILSRLSHGWTADRALDTPVRSKAPNGSARRAA